MYGQKQNKNKNKAKTKTSCIAKLFLFETGVTLFELPVTEKKRGQTKKRRKRAKRGDLLYKIPSVLVYGRIDRPVSHELRWKDSVTVLLHLRLWLVLRSFQSHGL